MMQCEWFDFPALPQLLLDNTSDEVYPRQCPCLRDFDSWRERGRWWIQRLQTETGCTREFTQVRPLEGKDLHPACLILYCWYSLSCYNGGADEIWPRWKKRRVLAYARGIYARSESYPPWPPLLALIWEVRSRDPIQVGYRCM
jgi:hypothetical protein